MRNFYLNYPDVQTVSGQLSWSHYCELLAVSDKDARSFYEKECLKSRWSLRELRRQINSALFQRLLLSNEALSRQKILDLANEGQIIEKPEDIIKDTWLYKFLILPHKSLRIKHEKPLHTQGLNFRPFFYTTLRFAANISVPYGTLLLYPKSEKNQLILSEGVQQVNVMIGAVRNHPACLRRRPSARVRLP